MQLPSFSPSSEGDAVNVLLVFPWGTEKAVHHDVTAVIATLSAAFACSGSGHEMGTRSDDDDDPRVVIGPMAELTTIDLKSASVLPSDSSVITTAPKAAEKNDGYESGLRGSVVLKVIGSSHGDVRDDRTGRLLFLSLLLFELHRLRSVDRVLLHVATCRCSDHPTELRDPLVQSHESIRSAVFLAGKIRSSCTTYASLTLPDVEKSSISKSHVSRGKEGLCCRHFLDPLYIASPPQAIDDSTVLFRVSAIRRNQTEKKKFTSLDLERAAGFVIGEMFWEKGWRVSMQYFNTEVTIIHDGSVAQIGIAVFDPPLPRAGRDTGAASNAPTSLLLQRTDLLYQLALGLQRRRIGSLLTVTPQSEERGEVAASADTSPSAAYLSIVEKSKGLMPHAASFKHDFRVLKGQNAMHPALGRCLLYYLQPQAGDVLLDPLCGSGSILLEAWLLLKGDVVLLGGDMSSEEATCSTANLDESSIREGVAVHRLPPPMLSSSVLPDVADDMRELNKISRIVTFVSALSDDDVLKPISRESIAHLRTQEPPSPSSPLTSLPSVHSAVFCWNAAKLPLRDSSVDCIVSDLPFGRRCGNHASNSKLYPELLAEFTRVLRRRKKGGDHQQNQQRKCQRDGKKEPCCVLLTIERRVMMEALMQQSSLELLTAPVCLDMGGLCPYVFVLGHKEATE